MNGKSRKSIFFVVLAAVSAVVLGYFAWMFLAPPPTSVPTAEASQGDIQTGFIDSEAWKALHPFAELPVTATNIGRPNPFEPIPERVNINGNLPSEGAGTNAEAAVNGVNAPAAGR